MFEVGGRALAYVSAGFRNDSQLTWFDRSGRELGVVGGVREVSGFDLSSDASAVVFSGRADQRRQSVSAVWLLDVTRGAVTGLTHAVNDADPTFGPPGLVVFSRRDSTEPGLYVARSNGGDTTRVKGAEDAFGVDDALDDGTVFYRDGTATTSWETNVLRPTEKRQVVHVDSGLDQVQVSPDGRWIAYNTIERGAEEVYVIPRHGDAKKWQVSTEGGSQPIWRGDGREIFYLDRSGRLMAVSVTPSDAELRLGTPAPLFTPRLRNLNNQVEQYLVASDGQRFLVKVPVDSSPEANAIRVIVNWPALLER